MKERDFKYLSRFFIHKFQISRKASSKFQILVGLKKIFLQHISNVEHAAVKGLIKKRIQYTKRDKRGLICELILPILMVVGGMIMVNSGGSSLLEPLTLKDGMYASKFQMDYNSIVPGDGSAIDKAFINQFNTDYINPVSVSLDKLGGFDLKVADDQGPITTSPVNIFSVFMNSYEKQTNNYQYTALIDTRAQEGSAYAMNRINNAILRAATNNSQKKITVLIAPFQKTAGADSFAQLFNGFTYALIMGIAMCLLPASLITYIVKERECNAKHQQIVSGASISAYWLSNFLFDIVKYMIPAVINVLAAIILNASALIDGEKLSALWLDFMLYGFAVIPFVYLSSFFFTNYGTAQIASFLFNFGTKKMRNFFSVVLFLIEFCLLLVLFCYIYR